MRNGNCYLRLAACVLWAAPVLAEVGTRAATLPPDPTNAALLYYQALLLLPEPNEAEEELMRNTPMDTILDYLRGAPIPFDPNVEPRLRELEAKYGSSRVYGSSPPHKGPASRSEAREGYELFSLQEKHDRQERTRGVDPNRAIRDYIARCRSSIELVWDATKLTQCDWGVQHSKGISCPQPQLRGIGRLVVALCADALIQAADGHTREALERCLAIRRVAHHIGHETVLLGALSGTEDRHAVRCALAILGHTKPDVGTMLWLRQKLFEEIDPGQSRIDTSDRDFEHILQSVRNNRAFLDQIHEMMRLKRQIQAELKEHPELKTGDAKITEVVDDLTEEEFASLTVKKFYALMGEESEQVTGELSDEALIALAAKPYTRFVDASVAVMESDMSYPDKINKLSDLEKELRAEYGGSRAGKLMMLTHPEKVLGLQIMIAAETEMARGYEQRLHSAARLNAWKAGIEVFLFRARNGRLPQTLPDGLPKDPYTGQDLRYEITEEGFALWLPDKNSPGSQYPLWEFKVQ